jgi:hypothetical protein
MKLTGAGVTALAVASLLPIPDAKAQTMTHDWDKVFPRNPAVDHQKVTFTNRYGITLSGDLYRPKGREGQRLAALAVGGPFGAVKEQSSGLYAQTMAARGFVALAFDPSFTGESGGQPATSPRPTSIPRTSWRRSTSWACTRRSIRRGSASSGSVAGAAWR